MSEGFISKAETKEILKPARPVTFGALRTNRSRGEVVELFQKVARQEPFDMLIAPEYTFYKRDRGYDFDTEEKPKPLVFEQTNGIYTPVAGDQEIIDSIGMLADLARETETNLCIGTVCEQEIIDSIPVFHNSAIVLDAKGNIVQVRRKFIGSDTAVTDDYRYDVTQSYGWNIDSYIEAIAHPQTSDQEFTAKAIQSALNTIQPVTLKTKKGDEFTTLIAICRERDSRDYLLQAQRALLNPVDAILVPVREGDDYYTERSQIALYGDLDAGPLRQRYETIEEQQQALEQTKDWWNNSPMKNSWGGYEQYMQNAVQRGVLSQRGIWLFSDGASSGSVGIFPAGERQAIKSTQFAENYLLANCTV